MWDREKHIQQREQPWRRVIVGMDDGYTNPAVALTIGEDSDGRLHVFDEWYMTKQLEGNVIEYARGIAKLHEVEAFIVDPSAKKLIESMRSEGLPVSEAVNDVLAGIRGVQSRLAIKGDGLPRLTVSPECENTIREMETYEWMKERDGSEKDKPRKQHDHAMDALRYAVAYADKYQQSMGAMSF
jgi:phage terminase large subunit